MHQAEEAPFQASLAVLDNTGGTHIRSRAQQPAGHPQIEAEAPEVAGGVPWAGIAVAVAVADFAAEGTSACSVCHCMAMLGQFAPHPRPCDA